MNPVLIALCLAQSTATVTLEQSASRLKEVLPELSKQTGRQLEASDELQGSFVVLVFSKTPAETALAEIAQGLNADWQDRKGVLMLVRKKEDKPGATNGLTKEISAYIAKARAISRWTSKDADKFVKKNLDFVEKHSDGLGNDWQEYNDVSSDSTERRLLSRVVASIGEAGLLSVGLDARVVYSTKPTAMQRPLGAAAMQAFTDFQVERQLHNEALTKVGIGEEGLQEQRIYLPGLEHNRQDVEGASNMLVVIKNQSENLSISLEIENKEGQTIFSTNDNVSRSYEPPAKAKTETVTVEGEYQPSEDSAAIGRSLTARFGNRAGTSSPEDDALLVKYFEDLEKNELLKLTPSEFLIQSARAVKKDLVAELPDAAVMLLAYEQAGKSRKLQDLRSMFGGFNIANFTDEEKCIFVRPGTEPMLRFFTIPRADISKFVRRVQKEGITIDALADLTSGQATATTAMFVTQFAVTPFPSMQSQSMYSGTEALRLYSKLDSTSRTKAKTGGYSVNIGALPPPLSKVLNWFVYTHKGKVSEGDARPTEIQEYETTGSIESTSVLPGGLPANGIVTFKVTKGNGLVMNSTYEGGYSNTQLTSAESIANQVAWQEVDTSGGGRTTLKFGSTDYEQLDVVITLGNKRFVTSQFKLLGKIDESKLTGPEGLPDDVKKLIDKRRADYKEMYKNGIPRPRQGTIKP